MYGLESFGDSGMYTEQVKEGFIERLRLMIGDQAPYTWARDCGIGKSTFDGIWNKGAQPQLRTLLKIAWKTNISLSWLLTGKGASRIKDRSEDLQSAVLFSYPQTGEPDEIYRVQREGYTLVPRCKIHDGSGSGEVFHSNQLVDHLAFKSSWISREMELDPKALVLVSVQGDSMVPTLSEGDLLLLDKRERQVRNDGIYVLRRDGDLIVKRLQRGFDGSIMIKSDNPAYETQIIQEDQIEQLAIIGRVVWTGRRV
jgi:phage repressor protein C with HTH and peptisase S24 domain